MIDEKIKRDNVNVEIECMRRCVLADCLLKQSNSNIRTMRMAGGTWFPGVVLNTSTRRPRSPRSLLRERMQFLGGRGFLTLLKFGQFLTL